MNEIKIKNLNGEIFKFTVGDKIKWNQFTGNKTSTIGGKIVELRDTKMSAKNKNETMAVIERNYRHTIIKDGRKKVLNVKKYLVPVGRLMELNRFKIIDK